MEDEINYRYVDIAEDIAAKILSGALPYRTQLHVRGGLAEEYDVSEGTIRRAIDKLADPGREGGPLVRKLPGAGTFVSWKKEG